MDQNTDDWQGNVGCHTLLINAHTSSEAVDLALDAACDLFFATERILSLADDLPGAISHSVEADKLAAPSGGGAWSVTVLRLGHARLSGSESSSDYFAQSVDFLGARPHRDANASRDPKYWRAVALAIDEKTALSESIAPVIRPSRKKMIL